jgi:glycosyltransferase involved in cell wall biosynthesis
MRILVPMPIRPNLGQALTNRMYQNLHTLKPEGNDLEIVIDTRSYLKHYDDENFFARLARMRQAMIDKSLRIYHDYVLWIDADIIEYPPDLFNRLRATGDGIVSPIVLIEGGTQNYDTAGMRESRDFRSSESPPYFSQPSPVVHLMSVGGCVLVPADIHRKVKFQAQDDFEPNWITEWWSLCEGALKLGYTVQCNTEIQVYHAELPNYGEDWH